MISLTCTHCQTVLSIDEAFAGGVCRCQHCGTIQTVPSHLKKGAAVGVSATDERGSGISQKALYQTHTRGESRGDTGSGTGLEDLAEVVASSGLSGSGLQSNVAGLRRPPRTAPPKTSPMKGPLLFLGGAIVAAAIGVGMWLVFGNSSNQPVAPGTGSNINTNSTGGGETSAVSGPAFCGVPLTGTSIIYILDRGQSAMETFDFEKEAAYRSIAGLGPDHKFQILLWDNKTGEERYPVGEPTFANKENLEAARRTFENVIAYHQSTVDAPLARAIAANPDAIVLVTAKGSELDDSFANMVLSARKNSPVKIYTISLRDSKSPALQTVAQKTGGQYKVLTDSALKAAVQ